jgi:hypothetical protein
MNTEALTEMIRSNFSNDRALKSGSLLAGSVLLGKVVAGKPGMLVGAVASGYVLATQSINTLFGGSEE